MKRKSLLLLWLLAMMLAPLWGFAQMVNWGSQSDNDGPTSYTFSPYGRHYGWEYKVYCYRPNTLPFSGEITSLSFLAATDYSTPGTNTNSSYNGDSNPMQIWLKEVSGSYSLDANTTFGTYVSGATKVYSGVNPATVSGQYNTFNLSTSFEHSQENSLLVLVRTVANNSSGCNGHECYYKDLSGGVTLAWAKKSDGSDPGVNSAASSTWTNSLPVLQLTYEIPSACENFNSTTGTNSYSTGGTLPSGWHRIYGGTVYDNTATSPANMPHVCTTSAGTPGAPASSNYLCFYSNSSYPNSYAIMPAGTSGQAVSHISFTYKFENASYGTLTYGAISGTDASTYTVLGTVSSPSSNPGTIDADLDPSQTYGKRIAFRWYKDGTWYTCGIDDICVDYVGFYNLTYNSTTGGSVSVTTNGNNAPSGNYYVAGTSFNITATPATGYVFNGWTYTGTAPASMSSATTTLELTSNTTLTANFSAIASLPYAEDFEGTHGWGFVNGTQTNQWYIGSQGARYGSNGLFISNDGGSSNAYNTGKPGVVYAYKSVNFASAGTYNLSFDLKQQGESTYDMVGAMLYTTVPTVYTQSIGSGQTTFPSGYSQFIVGAGINQSGGNWVTITTDFTISTAGVYYLVIAWKNDTSGGTQPPASIDNVSVVKRFETMYNIATSANPSDGGTVMTSETYTFDDHSLQGWNRIDADGDGFTWEFGSNAMFYDDDDVFGGHSGDCMMSGSYSNTIATPLNVDNYLVSPQVQLGGSISLWVKGNSTYPEHFGIAVCTASTPSASNFTTIQEWDASNADWQLYTADLSAYSGTGYVAIHNFNCYDELFFFVDDITINSPNSTSITNTVAKGTTCTLTATANNTYTFASWTENGTEVSSDNPYTFTVNGNHNLVANFSPITSHTVDFETAALDQFGFVNDASYPWVVTDCSNSTNSVTPHSGSYCMMSGNYHVGSTESAIEMTVDFISPGSISFYWLSSGEGSSYDYGKFYVNGSQITSTTSSSWNQYTYNVSAAGTYTFKWAYRKDSSVDSKDDRLYVDDIVITGVGYFVNVVPNPIRVNSVSVGSNNAQGAFVANGSTITATAAAATGYTFQNWTENGSSVSTNSSYSITVNAPHTLVANYTPATYTITATANPTEGGTVSGGGNYEYGTTCTLTAAASDGYVLNNWTKDGTVVGTSDSYSFNVTEAATYVANFIEGYLISNPDDVYACSGSFYDAGGPSGDYSNNENYTKTFYPGTSGNMLRMEFTSFYTESANLDYLEIYDGTSTSATLIGKYGGSTAPGTVTATNASGALTFHWRSDGSVVYSGFAANISCVPVYTITVSANPSEGGTVSGGGNYLEGTSVTATATPAENYVFDNWTENGSVVSSDASYTFTVESTRNLVANFHLNQVAISVSANPSDGGTVEGGGDYTIGTQCTVTAEANTGYTFQNWTENGTEVSTDASYTFTVSNSRTLVAHFTLNRYTVTAALETGIETAYVAEGSEFSGTATSVTVDHGGRATFQATVSPGYTFSGWYINQTCITESPSYTYNNITHNFTMTAKATLNSYEITATDNPSNGGTVTGDDTYNHGASCTVTATANTGYTFQNWTENGTVVSTDASYTFTVEGARDLVANFTVNSYQVTVQADPAAGGTVTGGGTYNYGVSCTVTTTVNPGYSFSGWMQDGTHVSDNTSYTFTVEGATTLVANFQPDQTLTTYVNPLEGGWITASPVSTIDLDTIGTGTLGTNTSPFNSSWAYSYQQCIYRAGEINAPAGCVITSISYKVYNNQTAQNNHVEVFMKNTNQNYIDDNAGDPNSSCFIPVTAADKVYDGMWSIPASGWATIILSEPFQYTGGNLMIGIHENTAGNTPTNFEYTTTDYVSRITCYGSNDMNPLNPGSFTQSIFTGDMRANVRLGFGTYHHGTNVTLTANANTDFMFNGWTVDGTPVEGNSNTYTVTMDDDHTVIANFISTVFYKPITGHQGGNGNWYLIASPLAASVSPGNVENMVASPAERYDLFYFEQAPADGLEWINYKALSDGFSLVNGKGYLYANYNDVTLAFRGTPYQGNGEVTLTNSEGNSWSGWNLVGNPFYYDAYIGTTPYYRMNAGGTEIVAVTAGTAIEPMEGVFVQYAAPGTVTFSATAPSKGANLALNILQGRGLVDRAIVNFGNGGTLTKFQLNADHTKVFIPQDGTDYAVVAAESSVGEIPVSFKAERNGTYTFSVNAEDVTFGYLHLIDNLTGADVDLLANPSYAFSARTTDYASRFRLVFATANSSDDNFGFYNGSEWIINNDGEATIQVIDVLGRILKSESIDGCARVSFQAAPGVYMLRLINGDNERTQKVIVR